MNNKNIAAFAVPTLVLAFAVQVWLDNSESKPLSQEKIVSLTSSEKSKRSDSSILAIREQHVQSATLKNTNEVWISEGMKAQMVDVAQAFKENMRYPAYSKPLHTNDWSMLNPRAFVPKLLELDIEGLSAEIIVDQYIVDIDKNLPVKINIQGLDQTDFSISEVRLSLGKGGSTTVYEYTESKGVLTYFGEIDSQEFGRHHGELPLNAVIQLDSGDETSISAMVKLAATEATLTSLGSSYVEGSDLLIPAHFDVSTPGFYRVRANLFDEDSGVPISHINSSFMLNKRENEGLLKVHASTLRSKGYAGPYILKDFDITRGPASPADKTGYGSSKQTEFSVQGFDLNSYSHEPYHDPKNQQRLEFLQKMAGIQ